MVGRKRQVPATGAGRRSTRSTTARSDVPDIYQEMLASADVQPEVERGEPPRKRRRPGEKPPPRPAAAQAPANDARNVDPSAQSSATVAANESGQQERKHNEVDQRADEEDDDDEDIQFEDVAIPEATMQTMERESDDDDDEDDELEFEDVQVPIPEFDPDAIPEKPKELELDLSRAAANAQKSADRRKPINRAEKDRRVEVHKTHLLCLLAHVARRNAWCNDVTVHQNLRPLLTKKMITWLNPPTSLSQFGRTRSLKEGLEWLEKAYLQRFQITERGMKRALWAECEDHLKEYQLPDDAESPMEKDDFREAAKALQGSRDIGAQLYCALLRSAGVDARLVCSLQPLSLLSGGPSMGKPPKKKGRLTVEEQYARMPKYDASFDSPAAKPRFSSSARQRLGQPNATAFQPPTTTVPGSSRQTSSAPKKIKESHFPIYWVEVLDEAHQKWQPLDPLVTGSFWKPQKFEPPVNDRENHMSYVVCFEIDGTAKDVTRRYAKAYNAKTRRARIETAIASGERWWRRVLRTYSRGYDTDMDNIENSELTAIEAREPMPRNVADFKDHPVFALERHLRRQEVIVPEASVAGTVGAGSKGLLEKIYRRKDVRIARSREKWYRMGREVRPDEIPVKFLPKRANPKSEMRDDEDADEGGTVGTPIFTMDQTDLYKAPPIINGRIPKNRFGNLDIYVPSMVPEGGAYIAHDLGSRAAFTAGVDYAPALTGFKFQGRHGTAVLHGVVVAIEHEEAVRAIISGIQDQEAEVERERRTREVLRTWKRFLMSLRVRQRIWANADPNEEAADAADADMRDGADDVEEPIRDEDRHGDPDTVGGGFMAEDDDVSGGGFVVDEENDDSDGGGGFIVDEEDMGGGFIVE